MSILSGTFASNTQSSAIKLSEAYGKDGIHSLYAKGTWDTGSVKVQVSPNGTDWFDLPGASLSADGVFNFATRGLELRLDFSGGNGSEDVEYWVW